MLIGLIGNQNSGKTTFFNLLTGSNQKVGNWPGVTIERKEGFVKGNRDLTLVDTPGVYSLSPYTDEEKVTRKFCLTAKPDLIINIIDATSIERSLYLTTQLLELNVDVIIALNMSDILAEKGIEVDEEKLQKELGTSVIKISAKRGTGINEFIALIKSKSYLRNPHQKIFEPEVQKELDHLQNDLKHELEEASNPAFAAVKLFQRDPYFRVLTNTDTEKEIEKIEKHYGMDADQIIADQRYDYIGRVKAACCTQKAMPVSSTDKIDAVVLNKWAAIPIFLFIMGLVYFVSVGLTGGLTSDFMNAIFNGSTSIEILGHEVPFVCAGLGPLLGNWIVALGGDVWAADLIKSGIVAGVGAVVNFIPQLIVLFLCLSILETSGYMSRISFFLDRIFKRFGLSGKSLIPFIVGTGCSVPAILSARTVENPSERKMTIILTPFMPCSAKLPVIALISAVLLPRFGWIVSLSVYVMAIVIILLSALFLKRKIFKKEETSFISELPAYQRPSPKYVGRDVYDKTISFLERAATIILLCSIVVWVLTRFSWTWQYVGPVVLNAETYDVDSSMFAGIGRVLAYLFIPMLGGNYSWGATVSLLQGLIAREQVVSSLSVISGKAVGSMVSDPTSIFHFFALNGWAAYAFLTFTLFSAPCVAAIAAMRKELGSAKETLYAVLFQTGSAFALASLIGIIGWAVNGWGVVGL